MFAVNEKSKPLSSALDGDSWQLAAELALKVIESRRIDLKRSLATGWPITGAVDINKKVKDVCLAGKVAEFKKATKQTRSIMIPANHSDELKGIKSEAVSDLEEAWRRLHGSGFEESVIMLPEKVGNLHVLIGESFQAALIPILLLMPRRVTLWYSDITMETAGIIKECLNKLYSDKMEIGLRAMPSQDMDKAYMAIDGALGEDRNQERSALISITGGNRLMGFAALLAGQNKDVTLIYRDKDAPEGFLIAIRHESQNGCYLTALVEGPNKSMPNINMEWLYASKERPKTAEELQDKLTINVLQ